MGAMVLALALLAAGGRGPVSLVRVSDAVNRMMKTQRNAVENLAVFAPRTLEIHARGAAVITSPGVRRPAGACRVATVARRRKAARP
jgi:hypothetical protein